ncbi:RWD domain-containing protein 2A-like isoform X2 [Varroa destructor]|uniref:RWD domain-containing protein n=1 Tax=Varroa destructor TaxID=109461 RepID=A0A7M7JII7_VARDE|nr:RWD domain-containing protein 2A-like isoform X2 [Varroa destructor]
MICVRENIKAQLNEIVFLENLYGFVKLSPHSVCEEFQAFVNGELDDVHNQLTCVILAKDKSPPVEVEVTLPHTYPNSELRLRASVRSINSRVNNRDLQEFVNLICEQHEPGTYCISFIIDYVNTKCAENPDGDLPDQGPTFSAQNSRDTPVESYRVWLLSHHIYDKVKRRKLVELSLERSLGGFCLPGKPGVICLEGDPNECAQAIAIIKSWKWRKIGVKFEEKCGKHFRFNGVFKELTCNKANQGAGKRLHMDLGVFLNYLEARDLKFAFYELFGIQ